MTIATTPRKWTFLLVAAFYCCFYSCSSSIPYSPPGFRQIEIVRNGKLEQITFCVPHLCEFLPQEVQQGVETTTKRDEQGSYVPDFFSKFDGLYQEMLWQNELRKISTMYWFAKRITTWKSFAFALAIAINILVAFFMPLERFDDPTFGNIPAGVLIFLEVVQLINAGVILFSFLGNYGLLLLRNIRNDKMLFYHLIYLLGCFSALFFTPLVNAVLLFDIVVRDETFQNVIRSVTRNGKSILVTAVFGLIVIYIFSVIGFVYLPEDFENETEFNGKERVCDTLLICIVTTLNEGLRNGGGIGDMLKPKSVHEPLFPFRVVYDLLFFFIVIIITLNLIFGVIIDTFADLRAEKNEAEENRRNTCFICGLNRSEFEHKAVTFDEHIKRDHNLWNYLYFVVHLKTKDVTEYTGPESFVKDLITKRNLEWFPRLRTVSIDPETQEDEALELKQLKDQVASMQSVLGELNRHMTGLVDESKRKQREIVRKIFRQTTPPSLSTFNSPALGLRE